MSLVFIWCSLGPQYNPGEPECANASFRAINERLCATPSWARATPLRHVSAAMPDDEGFNLSQAISLPAHVVMALIHMFILNSSILQDVDPVTEFIIFIIKVVPVMTVMLSLFNAGKSFLAGLLGRRSF